MPTWFNDDTGEEIPNLTPEQAAAMERQFQASRKINQSRAANLSALSDIGKYTRSAKQAMENSALASQPGADMAFARPGASTEELQRVGEGQALNSLYDLKTKKDYAMAYPSIASQDSEMAQRFVQQLNKQDVMDVNAKKPLSGLGSVGLQRAKEWDEIAALPEGEEKEAARQSYLMKWAPSTGYNASPQAIDQAVKKQGALIPGNINEAAGKSRASTTAKIEAETEAAGGTNPLVYKRTDDLRNEFINLPEIKSVKSLYQNKTKANDVYAKYLSGEANKYEVDQSLGYFASKALDPNSVVMPGEFDRFAKGLGFQSAEAMAGQLISGGLRLTDDQRKAMLNIVNNSMNAAVSAAHPQFQYYTEMAKKNAIDPENVVGGVDYIFSNHQGNLNAKSATTAKRWNPQTKQWE